MWLTVAGCGVGVCLVWLFSRFSYHYYFGECYWTEYSPAWYDLGRILGRVVVVGVGGVCCVGMHVCLAFLSLVVVYRYM